MNISSMQKKKKAHCSWVLLARILEWFPCSPPVDCVLSELFPLTRPSSVALQGMAHSFIELHKPLCHDKAVIHEGKILQIKLNYWASPYPDSFEVVATILVLVFPLRAVYAC